MTIYFINWHFLYFNYRLIGDEFSRVHIPTVEDSYQTHVTTEDESYDMSIIDTSGTMSFPGMRRLNISNADVIIIVFSLLDLKTFENIPSTVEEVRNVSGCADKKIIIVGNKSDQRKRVIKMEVADATVCIDWGLEYVETSAMDDINVQSLFVLAANQMLI